MKETLEIIIKSLVNDEEAISITEEANEKVVTFKVKVSKDDMGKVIGKQGKIARAIRTVMKSISTKENKKVNIEFID